MNLVFVGCGLPAMAREFKQNQALDATVWVDPKRATYRHLGFARGWKTVVDARALRNGLRAWTKGFRQGRTQGDPVQQGGVLVVERGGNIAYTYASAVAGDMPPTATVLERAHAAARRQRAE